MSIDLSVDGIVACLTSPTIAEARDDSTWWRAETLGLDGGTVFGGELLGQAIAVAGRIDPQMPVRSVHACFPRATRDDGSLTFAASTLHSGSAYATRRVDVGQPDRQGNVATTFSATIVCHSPATGINHAAPMPAHAGLPHDARAVDLALVPWDTRIVGNTDLNDRAAQPAELLLWTRVDHDLGDTAIVHQSLLAYLSDLTFIGTALLGHQGLSQLDAHERLRTTVLTHQLVFHRPFRIDEWLLLSQTSPAAADGTAFGIGHVFDQSGGLVASITQESMIRVMP